VIVYGLQSPFTTPGASIPGTIEAENFDYGGEGAAFHDTTVGNSGAAYRNGANDDVDVEATGAPEPAGFDVGFVAATEWLEYTVTAATSASYTVTARVASMAAGTLNVQVDGGTASTVSFPNTMGWQTFTTVAGGSTLTANAGTHVIRVTFNSGCNLNWINFTQSGSGQSAYLGTPGRSRAPSRRRTTTSEAKPSHSTTPPSAIRALRTAPALETTSTSEPPLLPSPPVSTSVGPSG